jgi:hypothetical protein
MRFAKDCSARVSSSSKNRSGPVCSPNVYVKFWSETATSMAVIEDAYWAEPNRLLAGPLPTHPEREGLRTMVRAMIDAGIRTVIDLRTPSEPPSIRSLLEKVGPEDVAWIGLPILNGTAPNVATLQIALDAIDAEHSRGRAVYVHCAGGRGRTGTVVACWWIRHGKYEPEAALEELMIRRKPLLNGHMPSPETGAQLRLVRAWHRGM